MKRVLRSWAAIMAMLLMAGGVAATTALVAPQAAGASTTKAPIKIGLVCGCTGPLAAAVVDVPPIYKAWADSVNAAGGINGHKVDVIYENDDSNPTTSTTIVHNFVEIRPCDGHRRRVQQ